MLIVGASCTVIAIELDWEQPALEVPVTVYVPSADTFIEVVEAPVDQMYEYAPLAVKLVLVPSQMVVVPEMFTFGIGLMVTYAVAEAVQPPTLVPVTV